MHHYFLKLSLVALLTSAFLLTGCKKSQPTQAQSNNQDLNIVVANDALMAQIKVAEVDQIDVSDILRVAGQIDFDEQALTRIGASVTGRITQINASLGSEVKKGDTLASINSSELSNSQLAYLKARSEKEFHRRTVQRAKTLFEADVISAAELQRRESEYEVASAQTRAEIGRAHV